VFGQQAVLLRFFLFALQDDLNGFFPGVLSKSFIVTGHGLFELADAGLQIGGALSVKRRADKGAARASPEITAAFPEIFKRTAKRWVMVVVLS
jgi:hypothetical protein